MEDSQDLFSRQDLKDAMKEAAKEALMEMNKKKSIQVQVADDSSWDLEPEIYSIVQTGPQGNRPQGQGYAPRQAIQGGRFPPQIS